ncbi:MAG: hypothetical protein HQL99_02475 [Magnetococcales bacterium]|nr:hypothetical protein [Magnetococcales bacterium]
MDALTLDGFTLFHHLDALRQWELDQPFAPLLVEIHPLAPNPKDPPLPGAHYLNLIRELGALGIGSVLIAGPGEPLHHPDTLEALRLGSERGLRMTLLTASDPWRRLEESQRPTGIRVLFRERLPAPTTPEPREYARCLGLPFIALVTADAKVRSCSDPGAGPESICGDLNQETFATLWPAAQPLRIRLSWEQDPRTACPPTCRHHGINRVLWRHLHPPEHVAFI